MDTFYKTLYTLYKTIHYIYKRTETVYKTLDIFYKRTETFYKRPYTIYNNIETFYKRLYSLKYTKYINKVNVVVIRFIGLSRYLAPIDLNIIMMLLKHQKGVIKMGLKYKEVDGMPGLVPFLDIDSILFNIGKQISVGQKELTRWKSKIKKNVCLTKEEDSLIEIEVIEGKNNGDDLEDLEIRLFHYPFIYYRNIQNNIPGKQGKELISVVSDLETLKEVIKSDMSSEEHIRVEDFVVLHYLNPINVKIVCHYNSEFIDYYTIGSWLSLDVQLRQQIIPISFEFDLYEIKREGGKTSYTKSLTSCTLLIDPDIDKLDKITIFKDGKEVKQGMRYIEKWVGKQLIYDRGKSVSVHELFKEGSNQKV